MTPKEARASGPSGNHAETAEGEAAKAAPRTEEKSAEKRTAERSSAEKSSAEKREEKAASHPAAEPRSNEKRSANSNAMNRSRPESENTHEKMAAHENERGAKAATSRAASKPTARKASCRERIARGKSTSNQGKDRVTSQHPGRGEIASVERTACGEQAAGTCSKAGTQLRPRSQWFETDCCPEAGCCSETGETRKRTERAQGDLGGEFETSETQDKGPPSAGLFCFRTTRRQESRCRGIANKSLCVAYLRNCLLSVSA